jgi:hypothetical protein
MMLVPAGPPEGEVTICHWNEGESQYVQETLPLPALAGHAQHSEDIWPPVEGWPDGKNWDVGQPWWEAGCEVPTAPTPTPPLPSTGGWDTAVFLLLFALVLVSLGWILVKHEGRQR